jgi:hypothetical protein
MNRTIASLAILKVNWDHLQRDYIENFVPFIATLITIKDYKVIDVNKIIEDFPSEYGLIIPYHPMMTILTRAKKRGIITKIRGREDKFAPVKEKIVKFEFSNLAKEQQRKQEKVISKFIDFVNKNYNVVLNREDAESALMSFLKEHDLEVLFAAQQSTILPPVKSSKKGKFLIYSFIKNASESEPEVFSFITDIAIGHILASALLYNEFDKFEGKLKGLNFYFDTRIILRLLGVEGKERKNAYIEFLKILSEERANLFLLQHTYDETTDILKDCLRWVENPQYDSSLASPALKYFVQNNYKASDVERFIVNVDNELEEYGISVVEPIDPNKDQIYQIDEHKLHEIIVNIYKERDEYFHELSKVYTIQRDIKSISTIYTLRKGKRPRTIKQAGSIFLTTNSGLAFANRKFEISEKDESFSIPACLTDIFIGTLVWLQSPAKVTIINEKKIIADCYAALQPNDLLIKKFLGEVDKLKNDGKINDDEYYLLRAHRVVMNLLEEKTMGDPDVFTDKTAEEILEEVEGRIKKEAEEKYLEEKERHVKTLEEKEIVERNLAAVIKTKEEIETNIEKRAKQLSSLIGWVIFVVITFFIVIGTIIQFMPGVLKSHKGIKHALLLIPLVILAALTVAHLVAGVSVKDLKNKIKDWIKNKVVEFLRAKK